MLDRGACVSTYRLFEHFHLCPLIDVERFLMTTSGSQRTGWHSASISFASVVERMVAASVAKPEAKMVGINHWYHHAASVLHAKAVGPQGGSTSASTLPC